jgi:monoamine oxidase
MYSCLSALSPYGRSRPLILDIEDLADGLLVRCRDGRHRYALPATPTSPHMRTEKAMRTPLLAALVRLAQGSPGSMTRRRLLTGSVALGAGAGAAALGPPPVFGSAAAASSAARAQPHVVIIGAGLAGLTAAYRLGQAHLPVTVYEASDRIGGRCWSNRDWADGQVSEHGGELIDTGHTAILDLIAELGLTVENRAKATPPGTEHVFFLDGAVYPQDEARRDLRVVLRQARRDADAAGFPILYNHFTKRAQELDLMSIRDWLATYVPGGLSSRVARLLDIAYTIEYGAETSRQSSLNLINLFGYAEPGDPQLFGPSDEVFHVAGGNDQIVTRLAAAVPGPIIPGTVLTAVERLSDGRFAVQLASGGGASTVVADRLLLALPFSLLRRVDLSGAGFPELKRRAIETLPMGQNTKLVLQFRQRRWYDDGCDGETFADTGYQATWETTLGQAGATGILTNFTGGPVALDFATDSPHHYARRFLRQLSPVLPDVPPEWTDRVSLDYWPGNPWTLGSYAYYAVGQYTTIAGVEQEHVGTCHFAGEHTSIESQGYLNGAVESGERAAREILAT